MALVEANNKFTFINIGDYGSNADGSVFKNCEFGKAFLNDDLDIPDPQPLPNYNDSGPVPFFFVGDEAFPLQVFDRRLQLIPDNVDKIVKACCVLHNFLQGDQDIHTLHQQLNPDNQPFLQDDGAILALDRLHGYHSAHIARQIRDLYNNYFMSPEGQVSWQRGRVGH